MPQEAFSTHRPSSGREVPDLGRASVRAQLTPAALEAVVSLADAWRLSSKQMAPLLGLSSEAEWFRIKSSRSLPAADEALLFRISALVGLYKGLHLLFSEPLADNWVKIPNMEDLFEGKSPIEYMICEGAEAMVRTLAYIDALRGGL